jgi:dTDP-4-amino-4,6-dideoxygalactose transaminase
VFDAAPAIGQTFYGSELACLSFNGNKTITTGQGGAVVGDCPKKELKVRHLAKVAKVRNYEVDEIGFNYSMPNLNAAMGCAQMERLDEFLESKRKIMARYRDAGLELVASRWMALWETENAPRALVFLHEAGIEARPFWVPLYRQQPYKNCLRDLTPNTESLWRRLVCLPCSTGLTRDDQDKVLACVSSLS